MKKICPSISELQAFDATARHLSFTKAGLELFVTQGAVSRHIANLEAYLGVALFIRQNNAISLTEDGQHYLKHVRNALHTLSDATQRFTLHRQQQETINISVPPTLASHFLLPLLADFYRQHPGTVVNFVPYEHSHNFMDNDDLDMAIQFGEGEWPGSLSVYLTGKETCVLCTPDHARQHRLHDIDRYAGATLLQHAKVPLAWVHWFQDHKLPFATAHLGPRFDQYSLIIEAARLGYGVGLVPKCLTAAALASGELISPLPSGQLAKQGYFLCIKKDKADTRAVRMFASWLTGLKLA
jgi:DNA-binding transcriptional LysR family regulator